MQSYALYSPKFVFNTVEEYKQKEKCKNFGKKKRNSLKTNYAVTGNKKFNWQFNSNSKGKKLVSDMQKLLLGPGF